MESTSKDAPAKTPELTIEERDQRLKLLNETRLDVCAKTFAAETTDPTWSDQAVLLIRQKYAAFEGIPIPRRA